MFNRKNIGSALVDYVIPTAVVGLVVGTGLYYLASEGKILNFTAASGDMSIKASDNMAIVGYKASTSGAWNALPAGSLGGTEDTPVSTCNAGDCSVDYGDFILNGIPENLSEFIEINGTSGGTEKIAAAMQQMADQLTKDGNNQAAKDLQDLSKIIKLQSLFMKTQEEAAAIATDPTDYETLIKTENNVNIPPELLEVVPTLKTDGRSTYNHLYTSMGLMKSWMDGDTEEIIENKKTDYFAANIVDQFDTVMANDNISSTMKNTIAELYIQADDLHTKMNLNSHIASSTIETFTTANMDPITGEYLGTDKIEYIDGVDRLSMITNPKYSLESDLVTSLMTQPNKMF